MLSALDACGGPSLHFDTLVPPVLSCIHGKTKSFQAAKIFDFTPILLFAPGGAILPSRPPSMGAAASSRSSRTRKARPQGFLDDGERGGMLGRSGPFKLRPRPVAGRLDCGSSR